MNLDSDTIAILANEEMSREISGYDDNQDEYIVMHYMINTYHSTKNKILKKKIKKIFNKLDLEILVLYCALYTHNIEFILKIFNIVDITNTVIKTIKNMEKNNKYIDKIILRKLYILLEIINQTPTKSAKFLA